MVWIQPLEIADEGGAPTGKFRLTAMSDEDDLPPVGLCSHEHDSAEEARRCPEAREYADA